MRISLEGIEISTVFQVSLAILALLLVLVGCILMKHTKDERFFNLMYIALGILIFLEFKGSIKLHKTMGILTDTLIWITIAIPTIYFALKRDVGNLAMVLVIPVIFVLMGLISTFGSLLNNI